MSKKLGVIGGMGSEATSYYFQELVSHTHAEKDQGHIDTIILNHASLPDRTEAILTNNKAELLEKMTEDAQLLERLGVENIAIPCNTSHFLYDEISKNISIPIIHMVRETVMHAADKYENLQKIGLMATNGTLQSKVYHNECDRLGIEVVTPSKERQEDVMSLIYDDIKRGHSGDYSKFQRTYDELMAADCDVIILACTELSVFKNKNEVYKNCIDAMDILVKESIERSEGIYQE